MSYAPAPVHEDHTRPAFRVAATIGIVKWIVVGFHALVAVVAFFAGTLAEGTVFSLLAPLVSGIAALIVWVMFGWAQHTLGMLATIARNTTR